MRFVNGMIRKGLEGLAVGVVALGLAGNAVQEAKGNMVLKLYTDAPASGIQVNTPFHIYAAIDSTQHSTEKINWVTLDLKVTNDTIVTDAYFPSTHFAFNGFTMASNPLFNRIDKTKDGSNVLADNDWTTDTANPNWPHYGPSNVNGALGNDNILGVWDAYLTNSGVQNYGLYNLSVRDGNFNLYSISNGNLTKQNTSVTGVVPEPATLGLLGLGSALIVGGRVYGNRDRKIRNPVRK